MNPGDFRHRVTIQTLTESYDSGETTSTWADTAERWAWIQEGEAREVWRAQQVDSQITHIVWLRYYDGLNSKDNRLEFGTRTLNIASVSQPDGRKAYHRLTCIEDLS